MPIAQITYHSMDGTKQRINETSPLAVTLVSDDAVLSGSNPIPISSEGITITVTPIVTAGAYTAGDCVGGVLAFNNAARTTGGGGVIKDLLIVDDAGQDVELELWLFDQPFTSPGDNAAWAATEAELHNLVAIITTSDGAWFATGTPSVARVEVSQRYDCAETHLFGQLVTRGTPTFVANDDVSLILGLLQD